MGANSSVCVCVWLYLTREIPISVGIFWMGEEMILKKKRKQVVHILVENRLSAWELERVWEAAPFKFENSMKLELDAPTGMIEHANSLMIVSWRV